MPEGDTIHKVANWLAPRLTGQTLNEVSMADPDSAARCTGRQVEAVHALGKHLLVDLDNETSLRSHLGMHGSWHYYRPEDEWQRPRRQASLILTTAEASYVCFNAKEVELMKSASVRRRIVATRLGPDLIDPAVGDLASIDAIVRRARDIMEHDDLIADVLLDQRVACGIGNVYKSEVLFIERLSPLAMLGEVSDRLLARCYSRAAGLLKKNLGGGKRVTRFVNDGAGRLWAYNRHNKKCLRCDAAKIRSQRLGRHHRSTYWCPRCQPTA